MSTPLIIFAAVFVFAGVAALVILLDLPNRLGGDGGGRANLRTIVESQRAATESVKGAAKRKTNLFQTVKESSVQKKISSRLTLAKKLKYAQWKMSPIVFHVMEIALSLFAFGIVVTKFNIVLQGMSLMTGPLFMRWLLNTKMDKRFKAFDVDYPSFLLSLVGLLKTGMNVMGGLEAAADGLENGSLVKQEVQLMIERLRFGVSEDQSIGSFAEDIFHPEIELFVQALLLSRRVGGTLSDTLDRLAKQVRKRQFFRASANAAVGLQRGSIWFIIGILVGIEVYLYFTYPQAVTGAWADELGWQVWQFAFIVILLGMFWVRQVTKIRV